MDEMGFDLDWLGFERPGSGTPFANTGQRAGQAKRLKLSKADLEALFEDVSCGDEACVRWLRIVMLRTLLAAAEQPDPCIQPTVLLTRLGGGAFGGMFKRMGLDGLGRWQQHGRLYARGMQWAVKRPMRVRCGEVPTSDSFVVSSCCPLVVLLTF